MKINKILLSAGVVASMFTMGSCVGDLDLLPTDPSAITPGDFTSDPMKYMEALIGDVYLSYATYGPNGSNILDFDGGMTTFQRAIFYLEETPTDEASWLSTEDPDLYIMTYGTIASNNQALAGIYARFFVNIAICNQFIQTVNNGEFDLSTTEAKNLAEEFIRQAKILRAGTYFYAIDLFGNVPWADETIPVGVGEVAPQLSTNFQEGRTAVYNKVVDELEEIVAWYKTNDPNNKPPYGYVGLDVAESLLVKFYLNAEVYTGTANWSKCLEHAQAVIGRLGTGGFQNSGLCYNYFNNFSYNNHQYSIGGTSPINEMIWTIPQQQPANNTDDSPWGLISYANGTFMCDAWLGTPSSESDAKCDARAEYNTTSAWQCIATRPQFVETFDWDDATMGTSKDDRVTWWKTSKDGFNIENTGMTTSDFGNTGYLAIKFVNWALDEQGQKLADQPSPTDALSIDYAVIRLAEIYLSAAEAILHGAGNAADALTYVNYIRERAGLDPYQELSLGELQNERTRELYTENVRRTDLIRYGKWISGYTWSYKGSTTNVDGQDYPSYMNVYPLPLVQVTRNGYTQNPGY